MEKFVGIGRIAFPARSDSADELQILG